MAAYNTIIKNFFLLTLMITFSTGTFAETNKQSQMAVNLLSNKILSATEDYGKRIEECENQSKKRAIPILDLQKLAELDISRKDAITAIAYLQFDNFFQCVKQKKQNLTFYLETMDTLKEELGIPQTSKDSLQSLIAYPSKKEILLEVDYRKLSPSKTQYIKDLFYGTPFDLYKALEKNNLLIEEPLINSKVPPAQEKSTNASS